MSNRRNLQIKCSTWAQVEAFYTRKLRRGNLLSVKVAFAASVDMAITIGLEVPGGLVMSIDGVIRRVSAVQGETRTWIEVDLVGLSDETLARLKRMVAANEVAQAICRLLAPSWRLILPTTSAAFSLTSVHDFEDFEH
jgi:hypothetical protein